MMKHFRKTIRVMALMLMLLALSGCKKEEPVVEPQPEEVVDEVEQEVEEEVEVPEEEEVVITENQNLLTGLLDLSDEAIGKRPVAVMVNNVKKALPQYGISDADVIFEIIVEGDQTRFMALYGDYTKVPKICSIRSCRKYFPLYSEGFDAVYVNWGMNKHTRAYIEKLNLTHYDGVYNAGGLFDRDQSRKAAGYALEHTGYFDGTGLPAAMEKRGDRTDLAENKTGTAFNFYGLNEQVKPAGDDCTTVDINFGAVRATFEYNEETKTYYKLFDGEPQVDGVTGEQLNFTNLFVLETEIGKEENSKNRWFDWDGSEDSIGYYISNGAVQKVHWLKENGEAKGYLKFYTEDGQELVINRGKTYIAINHIGKATFE